MSFIASVMEEYVTFENSLGILLLTDLSSYGYDKLCNNLNFPVFPFSLTASGDDLKLSNGGLVNGPAILFDFSSFSNFASTISGEVIADIEF